MTVRFLNENDYSQCVDLICSRKKIIERAYKEDYRYWIQPLHGWLHRNPYSRIYGNFINMDQKLIGYFLNDKLISMIGLIRYHRSDVGLYGFRVNGIEAKPIAEEVFINQTRFAFTWAEENHNINIFSFNNRISSINFENWTDKDDYLKNWMFNVVANYKANEYPESSWHQEVMEFTTVPFAVDICRWTKI